MDPMLFAVAAKADADAKAAAEAAADAAADAEWHAFYDECAIQQWIRIPFLFLIGISLFEEGIKKRILLSVPSEEAFSDRMSSWMEDVPRFGDIIVIKINWEKILQNVGFSPNPDTLMTAMKSYIKEWMDPLSQHDPLYRPRVIFCVLPPTLEELLMTRGLTSFQEITGMIFTNVLSALNSEMKGEMEGFFHDGGENFNSDLQEFIGVFSADLQGFIENPAGENFDSVLYRFIGNPEEEDGQSG
jgi:hypothetical protein